MRSIYFNHMMKTGGRSIAKALESYFGLADSFHVSHTMCDFHKWDIAATAIREPSERLLSHYRMLMQHSQRATRGLHFHTPDSDNPDWLGGSLESFLVKFPIQWKVHQLYFYSAFGNIDEAFENITKNTQIILTKKQQEGLDRLSDKMGEDYRFHEVQPPDWQTTKDIVFDPSEEQIALIKDVLKNEYEFYNRVIDYYNSEVQ